jgi:hypothetical protein
MRELLYLDQQRFDRYSAQATPSLAKVEKTKAKPGTDHD